MRVCTRRGAHATMRSMRILGIDPGLATIGLGVIENGPGGTLLNPDWLTISTPAHTPLQDRLREIHTDLSAFIQETRPELVVIEQLYFSTNVKTAIDVAQARGVIMLTLAQHALRVVETTPSRLKQAITGDGSADKKQMQSMLVQMLGLPCIPTPDDAADALALAVYGSLVQREASSPALLP
jgi:crossover junction endodeoxyribonuclease RuvC